MPRLEIVKETRATCNHAPNRKRTIVISTILVCLAASIGGLVVGCVLEVRWAIIIGIIGIGASILGLFIAMDGMRKEYIQSRDQGYTIDRVTIIKNDEIEAATSVDNNHIKVTRLV
jgi:hypothetical protein